MKSYTELEQSKVLVDILPIESADMYWEYNHNIHTYNDIPRVVVINNWDDDYNKDIPCWSLAALLDVMPNATLDSSDDHHYRVHCRERFTEWHDNAIDSCVEIIIKLHEKGLL